MWGYYMEARAIIRCHFHTSLPCSYTVHSVLYTAHCTLYTAYCTLHTAHCILHAAYCTLNILHHTVQTTKCIPFMAQCMLFTVGHAQLNTVNCLLLHSSSVLKEILLSLSSLLLFIVHCHPVSELLSSKTRRFAPLFW